MKITPYKKDRTYSKLVEKIRNEIQQGRTEIEEYVKNRAVETYWKVGTYIRENLSLNEKENDYGKFLFRELEKDIGIDRTTLSSCVKFAALYKDVSARGHLTWTHFRILVTIDHDEDRTFYEKLSVKNELTSRELQQHINELRKDHKASLKPATAESVSAQVKENDEKKEGAKASQLGQRLVFNRGELLSYRIIEDKYAEGELLVDLGFQIRRRLPKKDYRRFAKGDIILAEDWSEVPKLKKSNVWRNQLYTYSARIEKVTDGDTLLLGIEVGFDTIVRDHVRLRGINAPENSTPEGKKVTQYLRKILHSCERIVIRTYQHDQYDRYICDVFYLPFETDLNKIVSEGICLNQELLELGLVEYY